MKDMKALARHPRLAQARQLWQAQPARQRALLVLAALVVGVALVWGVALAPALATLRTAPAQQAAADALLQRMQALQAQASAMQSQPRMNHDDAMRALEAATRPLGEAAQLVPAGDSATLAVNGIPGDALARWLAKARVDARAQAGEARLTRNPQGTWDGTVVLALPPR
ncbi:type II secretion system protein GspM [Ramlibacter sp. MAHUQ-53]|uniref:type II secretion system protein GspM n=1 Tax=unclassified Ramlibacter TaxID=2617605 RepID=UPI0036405D04